MRDNKEVKKNVCTDLVHITDMSEQTPITDKTYNCIPLLQLRRIYIYRKVLINTNYKYTSEYYTGM